MQFTVQRVIDATLALSQIIRDRRPMPQRGKLLLARMHMKLNPEYLTIDARRDEMITAYGVHEKVTTTDPETGAVTTVETEKFVVPADKTDEFKAAWKLVADTEIEVDVEPILLGWLNLDGDVNGSIEASELVALGDLISE